MKNLLFSLFLLTSVSGFAQDADFSLFRNKKVAKPQICKPIKQASKQKNNIKENPCVLQASDSAAPAASSPTVRQEKDSELLLP